MEDGEQSDMEGEEVAEVVLSAPLAAKLQELLHYVTSTEIKLCADATKEFIKLLKSSSGGDLLHLYVRTSSKCLELLEAWKLRQGKPGMSYVFLLISAILGHPDGKYGPREPGRIAVARALDSFSRLLIDEKLQDVYKELNSKESKRQKAALQLMASIVRRGSDMASEVAKKFDFTLQAFKRLADNRKNRTDNKKKNSVRMSFVRFAMSFLEVGRPGLLRWILQQKDMFSGVLRGLGNDEDETIVYVLSTLRDRILTEESLVPPGLRSVLFGSVTLEQMVTISGRENGGDAAELAHNVLNVVCTDPSNGLMPDSFKSSNRLRGNQKRLLDLMKKLKATESKYHKDLLLALVRGRPSFGSAYLGEFPYSVEDHASSSWFSAISLAAEVVSSVGTGKPFSFLDSASYDPPSFDGAEVQAIIRCACPRPFCRTNMNKGLLHSDILVKNGSLRLLLEELKLLNSFSSALDENSRAQNMNLLSWDSLKREIQNEVRTMLPDPQVLLSLLSSQSGSIRNHESPMKRKSDSEHSNHAVKKMKTTHAEEDDIIVAGIASNAPTMDIEEGLDEGEDLENLIAEIWGFDSSQMLVSSTKDVELYFYSKILDAVRLYLRLLPTALEGSFDFFVNLLGDASALPMNLMGSILSLLKEYIRCPSRSSLPLNPPSLMYKHLQPFINLMLFSPDGGIRDQAYSLSAASMLSTGAFDGNAREVDTWFLFLPSYNYKLSTDSGGLEALRGFSQATVSFLCDAVSTVGNNLFKFWQVLRCSASKSCDYRDCAADFGPLTVCILQKCLRVLKSDSGSFPLPDKTMISFYVCNTLKYLLQTQVHAGLLSATIVSLISESIADCSGSSSKENLCEWRPLKILLHFAQKRLHCETYPFCGTGEIAMVADNSFAFTANHIEELVRSGQSVDIHGLARDFSTSIICSSPATLLLNFSSVVTFLKNLHGVPISILSQVLSIDENFLARISTLEPELFLAALEMVDTWIASKLGNQEAGSTSPHSISGASESATAAFSFLLYNLPFHVLFPAIMSLTGTYLSDSLGLYKLLMNKLFDSTIESLASSMRLVLFWVHQLQLASVTTLSDEIIKLTQICVGLLEHLLRRLMILGDNSVATDESVYNIKEVARSIFSHPAVKEALGGSLDLSKEFYGENLSGGPNMSPPSLPMRSVSEVDHLVLKIVETASVNFLSLFSPQYSFSSIEEIGRKPFVKAYNVMVKSLLTQFKDLFDICIQNQTLDYVSPTFNALMQLVCSLPPYELFEVVHWIFNRVHLDEERTTELPFRTKALSMGCLLANCAFENLITYMQLPTARRLQLDVLWGIGTGKFDSNIVEEIYARIFYFAFGLDVGFADACMLKALTVVHMERSLHHLSRFHPLIFFLSRAIARTPIDYVADCISKSNETRAKIVCLLAELSPLHRAFFIFKFSLIVPKLEDSEGVDRASETSSQYFLMHLPAVLSFLCSMSARYGKFHIWHLPSIRSLYYAVLWDGFAEWETFVSGPMFQEECRDWPSSVEELLEFSECSFLGKAVDTFGYILMLDVDHLDFSGVYGRKEEDLNTLLGLFDSVMPISASYRELLDNDASIGQSLNAINKFLARISLSRYLLFPVHTSISKTGILVDEDRDKIVLKEITTDGLMISSRIRLLSSLVSTWKQVVKNFCLAPSTSANGEKMPFCAIERLRLYNYFEDLLVRSIQELVEKMRDDLVQAKSVDFLEELVRSSLLYRFEDVKTLKMLQNILHLLFQGEFSYKPYLQLLISHSQFPHILHPISSSSDSLQLGAFFRPMSSILRSLVTPVVDCVGNVLEKSKQSMIKLEILKLLKTLLNPKGHEIGVDSEKDDGIDYRNLFFLLLSSYRATQSEIDLELYNLILEIESRCSDSINLAEAEFLWGSSSLKFQKEWQLEQNVSSDTIEQRRRSQVRENFPVDPKICANTVLYLHYKGAASKEMNDSAYTPEALAFSDDKMRGYDPLFILRFSLHVLSAGYVEPVEFASLGLLAVAFACLSSPDEGLRKLGYETLAKFKDALETGQKKKDVHRLRLLLNYVQNGIEEPWQRLPSFIGVFAAEASLVLLNPSHDHYAALNKLLMRSSRINIKSVPLFSDFLWSSTINFKSERMWILRLIYVALNIDDDSPILIKNCVFENLQSLFSLPGLDDESKNLILQIVRKSVKLPKLAQHLVEHCGLLSWLSTVLSLITDKRSSDGQSLYTAQLVLILEVIDTAILSENISEWLQKSSLEQLSKISVHLFKFLQGSLKLPNGDTLMINKILHILMFNLKISQKREMHRPHLTLMDEGIFQIFEAVSPYDGTPTSEYGLRAILMTTPIPLFDVDKEKLSKFLEWAICTARKSDCKRKLDRTAMLIGEVVNEESLTSKLLRWLTASVIHWKIYGKSSPVDPKAWDGSKIKTLKSLLEKIKETCGGSVESTLGSREVLAGAIFYLKQVLDINPAVHLPVVSALCVLLLDSSTRAGYGDSRALVEYASGVLSMIRCPPEANPNWTWSNDDPWQGQIREKGFKKKVYKFEKCEFVLVLLSNKMAREIESPVDLFMYPEDIDANRLFKWEQRVRDFNEEYYYLTTDEEDVDTSSEESED